MNKEDLKIHVNDMLLFEPWNIDNLIAGEYEIKETQEIWNNLKQESKDLIESYVLALYYHIVAGIEFSSIFEKINNYELNSNDNDDYVDNKGNIKFTHYDYLNVNFDSVVDSIVEYEFMNK